MNPGDQIGCYRVLDKLGAGGMGEVYRAHDTRLGRDVALKVLHADVASDATRLERFTREARAVAALNHPHIVTIHSTEEAEGVRFMTMELLEGRSVDQLIPPDGLPLARFVEIALPIADALTAAHQKQITHRDLKPANVVVTGDGRVKVLDFGLARVGDAANGAALDATRVSLTHEGTVVGTMPYMSPEQIEGRALDHRSDLFSLGVMFYEMLAGARPFHGESSALVMSSILRDTPGDLGEIRRDVPEALVRLIARLLEKRPDERVQTARDVYNELKHVQRAAESGSERRAPSGMATAVVRAESLRIAVKPFSTQGDREADALASGLTDDITLGLARFPYLAVATRATTEGARPARPGSAARYFVEGSVRSSGGRVRISVQLLDTEPGVHLWTETYNRDLATTDILTLQDDVVDRVVATVADVNGVLMQSMMQSLPDTPTKEAPLDELRLRYWRYQRQHGPAEHAALRDVLEALIGREPNRATGWTALAHVYCHEVAFGFNVRAEPLHRARHAVTRALDLDIANQHAWEALAVVCFFEHDRDGFVDAAERAMALNPRNTSTAAMLGTLFAHMGEHERGRQIAARAMDLNPHYPRWYHFADFVTHYDRGEYAEALRAARKITMPDHLWSFWAVAIACGQLGRADEARRALDGLFALAPQFAAADEAFVRATTEQWKWSEDVVEHHLEGFRKARALAAAPPDPAPAVSSRSNAERRVTAGRAAPASDVPARPAASVAVLPFADLSAARDQEWFCDGVAEEIINTLAKVSGLTVIARTSAFAFKGQSLPIPRIAEALGVSAVLEGSVRRVGHRIRVSAQLVQARDGAQLWSERYDRDLADVFAVQDEIASSITRALRGQLAPDVQVGRAHTPNVAAYEAYLMGKHYVWSFTPDWFEKGRDHYERAIALDPEYALPYLGLAELFHIHASARGEPSRASAARIRPMVDQALSRDPTLAEAHAWRGILASTYEYDWSQAARSFDAAMAIQPVAPRTRHIYGYFYLRFIGRAQDAVEEHRRALGEGDPLNLITRVGLVLSLLLAGRHEEQLQEAQRLRDLSSEFRATYSLLTGNVARLPLDEALSFAERLHDLAPWSAGSIGLLAGLHRRSGNDARAEMLRQQIGAGEEYGYAVDLTLYHLACGEIDRAFDSMELLVEQRHPFLMMIIVGGPYGEALRLSPRWPEFARTIGLMQASA